jgi:hypothetical protein
LIDKNKNKRLKFVDAIKLHPFFADINWTEIAEKAIAPPFKPVLKIFLLLGFSITLMTNK